MFILLDLRSKEEHRSDLQVEAGRTPEMYSMPRSYLGQVHARRRLGHDRRASDHVVIGERRLLGSAGGFESQSEFLLIRIG